MTPPFPPSSSTPRASPPAVGPRGPTSFSSPPLPSKTAAHTPRCRPRHRRLPPCLRLSLARSDLPSPIKTLPSLPSLVSPNSRASPCPKSRSRRESELRRSSPCSGRPMWPLLATSRRASASTAFAAPRGTPGRHSFFPLPPRNTVPTVHPKPPPLSPPPAARHHRPSRRRAAPLPPTASPRGAAHRPQLRFPKSPPQPPLHRRPEPPPPLADSSRVVPLLRSSPTHAVASLGSARTRRTSATSSHR
uniref:Far-red impaired response-like protein n=1 Tax=Oryza sativa subsp. japonica TaxID=39947 RepID=Q6Z0S6_ORYSJ|nr:far-red impaired response-like protein [Oryza sativa Japonica Group]BAD33021.1 far-red impaired response-like protein [Oryza sativa Japonica Group]